MRIGAKINQDIEKYEQIIVENNTSNIEESKEEEIFD